MRDCISRQMAIDTIMGQPPEPHYPSWYAAQIEKLPAAQPDHNADISEINKFIDGLEEILADIRERHVDDSVCGLCEYDGAYMGQSGDWCNECPGFDKDDCFKLSDETRKKWIEEIVNTYPDHTADIGKKVSISCGRENDLISRQAALKKLAVYIHLIDKTMGKGTLTDDDCMEAAKSVLGEDELPAVQPVNMVDAHAKNTPNSTSLGEKERKPDLISRQAAIDALKGLPTWWADEGGYYGGVQPPMVALLDPEDAVSAIENLPSAQPATNCSEIPNGSDDTISRRAAIDALDEQIEQCNKALGSFDISPKDEYAIKVERASLEAYKEQLENMPSAQPEQNGKWIYNSPTTMKCDRCGFAIKDWDWHRFKYCPNCRADMRPQKGVTDV